MKTKMMAFGRENEAKKQLCSNGLIEFLEEALLSIIVVYDLHLGFEDFFIESIRPQKYRR